MQSKPFENVKNQIGFCGLWCGSCVVGNGALKELTKKYEHILKGYGVNDWGAKDFNWKEFKKGLASIQTLPICQGCLKGDGNEECTIRPCALNKNISDCTECTEQASCKNLNALQKLHKGALRVGMFIKTDKNKVPHQQRITKWTAEIKNKFPTCVINIQT